MMSLILWLVPGWGIIGTMIIFFIQYWTISLIYPKKFSGYFYEYYHVIEFLFDTGAVGRVLYLGLKPSTGSSEEDRGGCYGYQEVERVVRNSKILSTW